MEMTLKAARVMKSRIAKEIDTLRKKREDVATVEISPNENFHSYINTTVADVTQEIESKLSKLFAVEHAIHAANNVPRVIGDRKISIADLLSETIELRREMREFAELAQRNPRIKTHSRYYETDVVVTYDIKKAAEKAASLTKKCDEQSFLIDKLDQEIKIDIDI